MQEENFHTKKEQIIAMNSGQVHDRVLGPTVGTINANVLYMKT